MGLNNNQLIRRLFARFHSRNPFELSRAMGCIVLRTPLSGVRGFHQYIKRTNIIYIDDSLEENQARFVCAHELGHVLLHKNTNRIFMTNKTFMVTSKYSMISPLKPVLMIDKHSFKLIFRIWIIQATARTVDHT